MRRREGLAKLTGSEKYIDDLSIPGCLWGMAARSPVPRGIIRQIHFAKDFNWSEFVVVDHRDIPGTNEIFMIQNDQPVLAADRVMHIHEPVVLLAHPDRQACRHAINQISFDIDPLPAALDYRKVPTTEQIQYASDNVFAHLSVTKGDVEQAFKDAPHVIQGIYETGAQEHVYLENQGMAAWFDDQGVLTVQGSMQCPYYVVNALKHALKLDESRVRVIQSPTGGGFGGKEDYPSNLACYAALLALKAQQPVKIIYDREEDLAATTKRHPARLKHRTAVDDQGRLIAQDIEMIIDGGAYVTLSPVVLSRGIIHAAGPYACDHVRIEGKAMLSNSVPFGAFRGFGVPQAAFAMERHMDHIARTLGIDAVEMRRRNLIRDGQSLSTGQVINDGTDRVALMDLALKESGWAGHIKDHAAFNQTHPYLRKGMGLACIYHGSGFTGSGEVHLASKLHVAGLSDGRIEIRSANTEIGQGMLTVFTRIASHRLGLEPEQIVIAEADTSRVPNSGPTVASRTTMVAGKLVENACSDLLDQLGLPVHETGQVVVDAITAWHLDNPGQELVGTAQYRQPPGINWDDKTYKGDAYGTYGWATYIARVQVDLRTCTTTVLDFHAVQEIGTVINNTLATGQIQGGVVQGIGWALMEECCFREGAMINNQLTNYIIPTASDVPGISVSFLENPYEHGAMGAKGLGELPMDGPAPAIANAVADALSQLLIDQPDTIPLTPERIMSLTTPIHA